MEISETRIGWHADKLCPTIASIRLRLLQPMAFLCSRSVRIEPYDERVGPAGYDALIFSKSLSSDAIRIARAAKDAGTPIIYDLCDNIFEGKQGSVGLRRAGILVQMLGLADHAIFSTPVLAEQVAAAVPGLGAKCRVIPDPIETHASSPRLTAGDRLRLWRLERFLNRRPNALHCVWFGKSQGNKAGMPHIHDAVREMERFARRHPVTLTIISNKSGRYWKCSRGWRIPHHHVTWSLALFERALAMHRVAIIPVQRNGYTEGKTINRPATAIMNGLGVIADSIPSYEELRPFIALDDWQGGLERYSRVPPDDDGSIEAARAHLLAQYSEERIGGMWLDLLRDVLCGAIDAKAREPSCAA